MSRKLFYIVFISLLSFFLRASAQEDCELPLPYSGNTGSNMTVFFTSGAVDALPISSISPYVIAVTSSGITVGSSSFASQDLIGGQQSLAVWGDDTATPLTDGALPGESIIFKLVDGNSLYDLDLTFAGPNAFVPNGQLPVIASSAVFNCAISINGCTDPNACNYDSSANIDDGSCVGFYGCMDSLYLEYDANASCDNGICSTLIVEGCTDSCLLYTSPSPRDRG